jgi:hypothetical protein
VDNTIKKYGIQPEDIYNFDETGFSIRIEFTSRVIISSDRHGRPLPIQSGDREWVTAIETVNSTGWSLPPMLIFKGKVHMSNWYEEYAIPPDWVIAVSDSSWISTSLD